MNKGILQDVTSLLECQFVADAKQSAVYPIHKISKEKYLKNICMNNLYKS